MARVIREEVQDKDGNIHYFHTEDCIVFGEDGRNLRETMGNVQFEDYTAEGTEIPDAETALAGITKGKKWTALFSNIKAFCKGVVLLSKVVDSENITEDGYLMSGKKCSEKFQEVSANFIMAINAIGDAVSGLGATVPEGSTYEDIVEIIKGSLFYKAPSSTMKLYRAGGNGEVYSTEAVIQFSLSSSSGSAFTFKNNGIYVNHEINAIISVSFQVVQSKSYNQTAYFYVRRNGSVIASKTVSIPGSTQTWIPIAISWSGILKADDLITLTAVGTTNNNAVVYMRQFNLIASNK